MKDTANFLLKYFPKKEDVNNRYQFVFQISYFETTKTDLRK